MLGPKKPSYVGSIMRLELMVRALRGDRFNFTLPVHIVATIDGTELCDTVQHAEYGRYWLMNTGHHGVN